MKWILPAIVFLFDVPVFASAMKDAAKAPVKQAQARKPSSTGQQYREDVRHFARKKGLREVVIAECPLSEEDADALEITHLYDRKKNVVYRMTSRSFRGSGADDEADAVELTDLSDCSKKTVKF